MPQHSSHPKGPCSVFAKMSAGTMQSISLLILLCAMALCLSATHSFWSAGVLDLNWRRNP